MWVYGGGYCTNLIYFDKDIGIAIGGGKMDKELIKDLKNGCTVWGLAQAKAIRELQNKHPGWVEIIQGEELEHILGKTFPGEQQQPYFGAILTAEGKANLC